MATKPPSGYAIVTVAGRQFHVEAGQELKVPLTAGDVGANLSLDRVLFYQDESTTLFGHPVVPGAAVDATILSHGRDPKITVFKFRRRKGYRKKNGHRQDFSVLRINGISIGQSKPPTNIPAEQKAAAKPAAKAASLEAAIKGAPAKSGTAKKQAKAKSTSAAKSTPATKKSPAKKASAPKKSGPTKKGSTATKPAGAAQGTPSKKKTGGA